MKPHLNPNALSKIVIQKRIRELDPLAEVYPFQALQIVDGNPVGGIIQYVSVESTLSDAQVDAVLSTPQAAEETTAITQYINAITDYSALNGWYTWNKDDAVTNITNAIFGGKTQAQVDADIDALPATIAGMRTGLHSAAAQILTIRNILTYLARAVVFLRDYAIRLRR